MTTPYIRTALFPDDVETVRLLFREYVDWLGMSLDFQGFEAELTSLPGKYAQPCGICLIAENADGAALGCVAMRPLDQNTCEMKRLYLRPAARGLGLGYALSAAVIDAAKAAGYQRMVLDTLRSLDSAIRIYDRLGFEQIDAYYQNPLPGVVYMGISLDR